MGTAITKGIKISVTPSYMVEESHPARGRHLFSYLIEIENVSDQVVQLMSRHWYILDSFSHSREVEGEGVVGQQPILHPGQFHRYTSWCPLESDIGLMFGFYKMRITHSGEEFEVRIPEFTLCSDAKLN
jgi:ApaG protein